MSNRIPLVSYIHIYEPGERISISRGFCGCSSHEVRHLLEPWKTGTGLNTDPTFFMSKPLYFRICLPGNLGNIKNTQTTMRCQKCGWPNKPGETSCIKCGTPLESPSNNSGFSDSSPIDLDLTQHSEAPKKTVLERHVRIDEPEPLPPTQDESNQPLHCPKCNYLLRPGATKCPNCQTDLSSKEPQVILNNNTGNSGYKGTVNVWTTDGAFAATPSFSLEPVKKAGDKNTPQTQDFEGESVSLNRDNVDPGNMAITSKTQAIIYRNGNEWVIEDKSDQKTTFVQVNKPMALHEGDTILLGNRLFVFHE